METMKINKLKLDEFIKNALYVSEQILKVAVKYGYHEMNKKSEAYAVYSICTEIYNVVPVVESELDYLYYTMVYNSLRLLLDSMCNDQKQYHVEVLDACNDSSKVWDAFNRMKHVLDNVESELFSK